MKIYLLFIIIHIYNFRIQNGIYIINNVFYNYYLSLKNDILILSDRQTNFRLVSMENNLFYIETISKKRKLGINRNGNIIIIYDYNKNNNNKKIIWNITNITENEYLIQNYYSQKFIQIYNHKITCSLNVTNLVNYSSQEKIYKFNFIKVVEEGKIIKKYLKFINNEPVDVVLKYIDLTDKNLKRDGINQIYKDKDNEELRYCIRSILENIPWIRKIYILMPNNKVKFLKNIDVIKDKIIYIKDKDLLGFDSANIHAFTFNLYKLFYFGVSENFIYMEDDFFIGKPLKKLDFFYYDEKKKKIVPYLLTKNFNQFNKSEIINKCDEFYKNKDYFHPHSGEGWWFSIFNTNKYLMEKYTFDLINTEFTHNAIGENLYELRDIFKEIKDYEFINETLFSKERHILTLNQPHFFNLYQLNILHKNLHIIPYQYILIETIKKTNLDTPLFVLNTGGNHIPTDRQNKIQKKIMEKRFPFSNIYENINKINKINNTILIKFLFLNIFSFINLIFIKILFFI